MTALLKLFKLINSEDSPKQISVAIMLAFIVALLPLFSGAKWLVLLAVFLLRIHLSTFFLFLALFGLLVYPADPSLNQLGFWLLSDETTLSIIKPIALSSVGEFLALNNTLALAALLSAIVLSYPVYRLALLLIARYRIHLLPIVQKMQVVQMLKASRVYQLYEKIN